MKGRWVAIVATAVLLGAAGAGWYWWPRHVAPGLTPQMVKTIDRTQREISLVDGGSRRDAHTLWDRYHERAPLGTPPTSPRLLGISLAKVDAEASPGSGTYWVIYFDRVWMQSLGLDTWSGLGRQVIFVDPDSLREVATIEF